MNFVFDKYGVNLFCPNNAISVITIENKTAFAEILQDLWRQAEGDVGEVILSEDKPIVISKRACIVINPFSVDCNDKKIINYLYQEVCGVISEKYATEWGDLNARTVSLLDEVMNQLPYNMEMDVNTDVVNILKDYKIRLNYDGDSLLEHLIDYIRLMHQVCRKDIIVFLNLKQFLTDYELKQLYEFTVLENLTLMLLEGAENHVINGEKHWIIDRDLCIIEI